jgi:hypothetical protein
MPDAQTATADIPKRKSRRALSDGDRYLALLAIVMLGYALMGKGFAYLGFPLLYVGEIAFLAGIVVFVRSGALAGAVATLPALCVSLLEANPDTVLAHTGAAFINERGERLHYEQETGGFVDRKTGRRYWADAPSIGDTPSAVSRFWQVLTRARWGTHMFGVIRREARQQTSLLPNFAGSNRAMLAELALLGRFRCANQAPFLTRFHAKVSPAPDHTELRSFLGTDDKRYSRRIRQIKAFFGAPKGKPIGALSESVCLALVAVHGVKVVAGLVAQGDPRTAAVGYGWPGARDPALRQRTPG